MKTKFAKLVVLALVLLVTSNVFAQEKKNAIKINLFGVAVSQYQFAYERAFSENISAQLSFGYISRGWGVLDTNHGDMSQSGIVIIPEARYYFKEAVKGPYGSAFFRYFSTTWKYEDNYADAWTESWSQKRSAIGGGVCLGWQFLLGDVIVLDIFAGPQFKAVSVDAVEWEDEANNGGFLVDDSKVAKEGVGLRFGINFGVAF